MSLSVSEGLGLRWDKKHKQNTFPYIDETPKRSHTRRLVSKPPCSTVVDTVNLDICVKVFIYTTIHRFIYIKMMCKRYEKPT